MLARTITKRFIIPTAPRGGIQLTSLNLIKQRHTFVQMANDKCVFCKICRKEAPAEILYEDETVIIFKDIKPSTRFHYLAVPKQHIDNAKILTVDDKPLVEKLIADGKRVLSENGGDDKDIRMGFHWPPFNSINHLHLHVISPVADMGFFARQIFRPNTWWFASADYVMDQLNSKL